MNNKVILLVEDNPDDVKLTMRALKKANVLNEVVVAQDGAEALDYLFGTGKYAGRDVNQKPQVVLLDLKMPKVDGLEVLHRIRGDERICRRQLHERRATQAHPQRSARNHPTGCIQASASALHARLAWCHQRP